MVKVIEKFKGNEPNCQSLRNEAEVLTMCKHPNIQEMVEFFENDQEAYLVTRRCQGGDIQMHMQAREFREPSEGRMKQIARGIAAGVKYIHDRRIIHRDIKAENILLSSTSDESNPIIADFGLATVLREG